MISSFVPRNTIHILTFQAEMRETSVLQSLSECLGEAVWSYIEYREQDWSKEPHIGGGPVSCVTPGGMKYFTRALRHPYKMYVHMYSYFTRL